MELRKTKESRRIADLKSDEKEKEIKQKIEKDWEMIIKKINEKSEEGEFSVYHNVAEYPYLYR